MTINYPKRGSKGGERVEIAEWWWSLLNHNDTVRFSFGKSDPIVYTTAWWYRFFCEHELVIRDVCLGLISINFGRIVFLIAKNPPPSRFLGWFSLFNTWHACGIPPHFMIDANCHKTVDAAKRGRNRVFVIRLINTHTAWWCMVFILFRTWPSPPLPQIIYFDIMNI